MRLRILIFFAAFLFKFNAIGQKAEIDNYCQLIDSLCVADRNIILHSVRHQASNDSLGHYDRYYIDTVKGELLKSIYDFDFYGDGEYLEFYYQNGQIVKANAKHKLDEQRFSGTFYFKNDSLIAQVGGEIRPGETVFDVEQILKTGNDYKRDSFEILNSQKLRDIPHKPEAANTGFQQYRQKNINSAEE